MSQATLGVRIPEPTDGDPDDVVDALDTATILLAKGELEDALRWVRRGAESASDHGDEMRALSLTRVASDLRAQIEAQAREADPVSEAEPVPLVRRSSHPPAGHVTPTPSIPRAAPSMRPAPPSSRAPTPSATASVRPSPTTSARASVAPRPSSPGPASRPAPSQTPAPAAARLSNLPQPRPSSAPSASLARPSSVPAARPSTPSAARPSTPFGAHPSTPSAARPSTPSTGRPSTPPAARPSSAPAASPSNGSSVRRSSYPPPPDVAARVLGAIAAIPAAAPVPTVETAAAMNPAARKAARVSITRGTERDAFVVRLLPNGAAAPAGSVAAVIVLEDEDSRLF